MDGAQSAETAEFAKPKRIILFSDGTGNSSRAQFRTNVWRLYEALDLGPRQGQDCAQVALYSNGVGTSSFRPLAMLGGIFGVGLKPNVLTLYEFLCRNWRPGDQIFAFGFSRGAFTIRLLVALIAHQGIIRGGSPDAPPSEAELSYMARAAYREYARAAWPNRWPARLAAKALRRVRDAAIAAHRAMSGRKRYEPAQNELADIEFVGVWDTVAAYGGPIVEITRGIDDWIWPLTMSNYGLSPRVRKARHALALDDQRDSFQPLLWDEVRERVHQEVGGWINSISTSCNGRREVVREPRKVEPGRLKQVWFAGMHSDVGGGYPDESLSYVSLVWMLDEIDGALDLIDVNVDRIRKMANAFGTIHDSRSGFGIYYRYQPRRIGAFVEKPRSAAFLSGRPLRDPQLADRSFDPPEQDSAGSSVRRMIERVRMDHGLLRSVTIHESVIRRIEAGTDNYAPLSIPLAFDIEHGACKPLIPAKPPHPLADTGRKRREGWLRREAIVWDMVWSRRIRYFGALLPTLLLAALPLYNPHGALTSWFRFCTDSRCVVRPALELVNGLTGGYLSFWIDAIAENVVLSSVLAASAIGFLVSGRRLENRMRSRARCQWDLALGRRAMWPPGDRGIAAVRDSRLYVGLTRRLKWDIAPAVTGWATLLLGAWALSIPVIQTRLAFLERGDRFCPNVAKGEAAPWAVFTMRTNATCNPAGALRNGSFVPFAVEAGKTYSVQIEVKTPWKDKGRQGDTGYDATPARGANLPWTIDLFGKPYRRMILAGWMAPLLEIKAPRPPGAEGWFRARAGYLTDIQLLSLHCGPGGGSAYIGRFKAPLSGNVSLFVNDAVLPFEAPGRRYTANEGTARVQIWRGTGNPPIRPDGGSAPCDPE
jgi:uncharacterized protein (DUF2235 family)